MHALRIVLITIAKYLAIWIFWLPTSAQSQTVPHIQITPKDGLPASSVYQMIQDEKGYVWLGTSAGLVKQKPNLEFELIKNPEWKGDEIYRLTIDHQNKLWFNNISGQIGFCENDSLYILSTEGLGDFKTRHFTVDKSLKRIFLYGSNDVYAYNLGNGQFEHIFHCTDCDSKHLSNRIVVLKDAFYVLDGIHLVEQKSDEIKVIRLPIKMPEYVFVKTSVPFSNLWISGGKSGQLSVIKNADSASPNIELKYLTNPKDLFSINEDELGNTWVNTGKGAKLFTPDLELSEDMAPLLPGYRIHHVLRLREGGHIVSTSGDGLFYIPSIKVKQLFAEKVKSIKKGRDGRILVTSQAGKLYIIKNEAIVDIVEVEKSWGIRSVLDFGDFIFISFISGVPSIIYDLNTGNKSKVEVRISSGLMAQNDSVYFSEYRNSFQIPFTEMKDYLQGKRGETDIPGLRRNSNLISDFRTRGFFKDKFLDKVWMGGINILSYYDAQLDTVIVPFETGTWELNIAQCIDSTIWVGTSGGLLEVKNDKLIRKFTKEDGLVSEKCFRLFCDESNLWIGTAKGLMKMDIESGVLKSFGASQGVMGQEVWGLYKEGGKLWVGTDEGLFVVDELGLKLNDNPPPIYIDKIKIWEKDTVLATHYSLPYKQNNLTIQFEGLAYQSLGNFKYKYRMLGIDSSWTFSPGSINFARYPQLGAGEYTFQVKAINEDGMESIVPAEVSFLVHPPFWKTWWFQGLMILGVLGLTVLGTLFFQKRKQRVRELERRVEDLKMEALVSQMNPHFIFNALNAIQLTVYEQDKLKSTALLSMFSDMMRSLFDHSQKEEISLEQEIAFLKNYLELERLRFEDRISIIFEVDDSLDTHNVMLPPLLIQPIVENSFKHGLMHKKSGGELKVHFLKSENKLIVKIKDNGVGRKKALEISQRRGRPLRRSSTHNIVERIELLNRKWNKQEAYIIFRTEDLIDTNGKANGTLVELTIKL